MRRDAGGFSRQIRGLAEGLLRLAPRLNYIRRIEAPPRARG